MIAMSPLEQACAAWTRQCPDEISARQAQFDDATALGQFGVFSNRNISHITTLDPVIVRRLTGKTDKTGGRLNPESLPLLLDAAQYWAYHHAVDAENVRAAIQLGTSWSMMSKLTGIPRSTAIAHAKVVA